MGNLLIIPNADFSLVSVEKVTPIAGVIIRAIANPFGGGTVIGGGLYQEGDIVTLEAIANYGYTFMGWSDGVVTPERTITVGDSSMTYMAIFKSLGMVAQDGWIDAQGKKSKSGTGAFFGAIEVKQGDYVQFIKTTGGKSTWYAWLAKPLYVPTSDGEAMSFAEGSRSILPSAYDKTVVVPVDCYLAVSLFANDGDEQQNGSNSPNIIKINGQSISIPTEIL